MIKKTKMRNDLVLMLILFFSTCFLNGQSLDELNVKLDSLNFVINNIDLQINDLNKRKSEIHKQISELNQKKNQLELYIDNDYGTPVTINFIGGILRDKPNHSDDQYVKIPSGDTVLIFNWYEKPFFKASYKGKIGYISYASLNVNPKIESIIKKDVGEENPTLNRLTKAYGAYSARRIINGDYWIGMTTSMAKESMGNPDKINKTTGQWGIHEQWIYEKKDIYLYFENGKLTTIQD
jgi:hypothetical protein